MTNPFADSSTWRKIAEQKIQQSLREGQFDQLEGMGKPFGFNELEYDPNWWIKAKMKREQLTLLAPALVLKRNVERRLDQLLQESCRHAFLKGLGELNEFIRQGNLNIGWGPPSDVMPFDISTTLERWHLCRETVTPNA